MPHPICLWPRAALCHLGARRIAPLVCAFFIAAVCMAFSNSAQAGTTTILHSFLDGSVTNDGEEPPAALIQSSDGNFYGVAPSGGTANSGIVFKITPSGTLTILHLFGDGTIVNDGAYPSAALIRGSDGNFYGTTRNGGQVQRDDCDDVHRRLGHQHHGHRSCRCNDGNDHRDHAGRDGHQRRHVYRDVMKKTGTRPKSTRWDFVIGR